MQNAKHPRVIAILVLIPLVLSLLFPSGVVADETTPPPPADQSQPTQPPEAETPVPPTDASTEDPPATEPPPTEPLATEQFPTDLAPADSGATELAPTDPATQDGPTVNEIVDTANEIGVTLADGTGDPIQMGTLDGAEALLAGDPWFQVGTEVYRFLPTGGNCGDYSGDSYCGNHSNPIQAALDYISDPAHHDLFYDAHDALTLDGGIVHVESGTYHNPVLITIPNITLYGNPGNLTLAGAADTAPVLHGTGTNDGSVGVTINAEGVSLIGFILENWETAILQDVLVGTTTTHIENNTIRDNDDGIQFVSEPHGKPGSEVNYNVFHGNTGYDLINAGASGVSDNNIQDINATNNYWGCEQGPVVTFQNADNGGDWDYIVWNEVYHQSNSSTPPVYDDNPYPDCGLLYGRDSLFMHGGNNYKPYKIIIDALASPEVAPYCGDGIINRPSEECDGSAPANYSCVDCSLVYQPYCGDGVVNQTSEECDGSAPAGQTCTACLLYCTETGEPGVCPPPPTCGNGSLDTGEQCDGEVGLPDPNPNGVYCNASCQYVTPPYCGDGQVNRASEQCDGSAPAHYSCVNCNLIYQPYCGDGIVNQDYEECDGSAPDHYSCVACELIYQPYCGDGMINQAYEECDGSAPDHYSCVACELIYQPYCGDGIVQPPEACDGSAPPNYSCVACNLVYLPYCGDGIVQAPEACDGSAPAHYSCVACNLTYQPYCGDGIVNQASEQCDGSAPAGQTCSENCVLSTPSTPLAPAGGLFPALVDDIAAGYAHTCAITPLGGVQCWGDNTYGQLGDGTFAGSNIPVDVLGLESGRQIVAGANHTCLLDGTNVWCWGQNDIGQIGDGTTTNRNSPTMVLTGASYLTAGADYTCAALLGGEMMCWGNNSSGQLGDGTQANHSKPTLASLIADVWGADGGQTRTCALTPAGQISCWTGGLIPVTGGVAQSHRQVSANRFGAEIIGVDPQGVPIIIDEQGATPMSGMHDVLDVDSGVDHVCALLGGGSVRCWGANQFGQLGNNSTVPSEVPVSVMNLGAATDLAVGRNHACVIVTATMENTVIRCWGLNSNGQLGNGSTTNSSVAVDVK